MKRPGFSTYISVVMVCSLAGAGMFDTVVRASPPAPQSASAPAAQENVQRGAKLFASSCSFCHGPTGKGSATGVSLIDSSLVRHDKGGDLIAPILHEGRLSKGMPAFPIFDAVQVSDIVAFLHDRIAITDSVETRGPHGGYQLQHLLTGSADAGKEFFNGPGGCAKCHSVIGDLAGIAKKYQPTELEARFLYPRDSVATATVTLPSGQIFKGTLQHHDAFYIALKDGDGHYHSWPISGVKVTIDDPLQAHVALLDRYTNKDVHDVFAYLDTLQ